MSDINIYLGRLREEETLNQNNEHEAVSVQEVKSQSEKLAACCKNLHVLSVGGPSPLCRP